jgi:hypothetical protein
MGQVRWARSADTERVSFGLWLSDMRRLAPLLMDQVRQTYLMTQEDRGCTRSADRRRSPVLTAEIVASAGSEIYTRQDFLAEREGSGSVKQMLLL